MPVTVVIGAQWGDEGKGKIVDYLAQKANVVVRVNGGDNAGHTVTNQFGEFKLHLVPVGIFNPQALCIIGNGVAVNPKVLVEEIEILKGKEISCHNLKISTKAHLTMPWHILLDGLQEKERGQGEIGTTRRGIGPVFSDKFARFGLRVGDLLDEDGFSEKLLKAWGRNYKLLTKVYNYHQLPHYSVIRAYYLAYRHHLLPHITETEPIIWEALDKNKEVLLEGAQGTLLDPDFGTYPQTTSSPCTTNGALQGSGISWKDVTEVIGVVKSYTTRVCEKVHYFATEMPEEIANPFREKTKEYGATTGRARRIGWLDIPQLRYVARINGFTSLAVTRLDNLGILPRVKICCGHSRGKPIYWTMPGWDTNIGHCRRFSQLPKDARNYLSAVEGLSGVPIRLISVGPERNQIIVKE